MPGIWGIISEKGMGRVIDLSNAFFRESGVAYLVDYAKFPKATFGRFSVNKFQRDKLFKRIGNDLIVIEGIIFNLRYILHKYNTAELGELILKLYSQNSWNFVKILKGNFAGFMHFKRDNKLIVFTDHIASKPIYYFYDEDTKTLIFASELKVVVEGMKYFGFVPHLDISGAYCLLTLGYMYGDLTLVEEIKKLPPGNDIVYEDGKISINNYYKLSNKPYVEDNEEEIIKELDRRFKEAVKLEYEKDLEYGYNHIATLSCGLDSRTNIAYAKKLGFEDIICFTFSQSNYLDEKIAKKIASDWKMDFIFFSLDNGTFLCRNIEKVVGANDGLILYGGGAFMYDSLRKISFNSVGLVHTGALGDAVLGTYLDTPKHDASTNKFGEYSNMLIKRIQPLLNGTFQKYSNAELYKFYNRGINGMLNGYRFIEQFTEFSSPFLYIDFLDYAMKIAPKYRYKESIYLKWINKYIPESAKYKWGTYELPPKYPLWLLRTYGLITVPKRVIRRKLHPNYDMTPYDYWWESNKVLREKISSTFKRDIKLIENYPSLLDDINRLFEEGSLVEKTQVITLLKALKLYDLKEAK